MAEFNHYQEICRLLGAPASKTLSRIVELIADEKECKIVLAAFPAAAVSELSDKTGIPHEEVQAMVRPMFLKGLLFMSKKEGEPRYYRVKSLPQFHDSSILWKGATREFHDLWKEFMACEWREFGQVLEAHLPNPVVRVVPVGVSVEAKARILAHDDVQAIINNAKVLAVTPCTCRVIDGKCGKPVEVCIQINRAAEYSLERGTGRSITKEEAMQIIHMAEEAGLVHVVDNKQSVDHIICNCCKDCCMNWRLPNPHKFVAPSRYQASVSADLCTGCGTCVDRCFFDAISLDGDGQTASITSERCVGCGVCAVTCPTEAISLKEVRPPEVIPA
jgi:ferredoxin